MRPAETLVLELAATLLEHLMQAVPLALGVADHVVGHLGVAVDQRLGEEGVEFGGGDLAHEVDEIGHQQFQGGDPNHQLATFQLRRIDRHGPLYPNGRGIALMPR